MTSNTTDQGNQKPRFPKLNLQRREGERGREGGSKDVHEGQRDGEEEKRRRKEAQIGRASGRERV